MDKKMEQVFAPLRAALLSQPYGLSDLLEIVGSFAQSPNQQHIAAAISLHARDILSEQEDDIPYNVLIAETYRRTFFDATSAAVYETDQMLQQGPERMQQFTDYLIGSMSMDQVQENAGSRHVSVSQH